MELKKCKNGHTYDPAITPECPECASLAGHTVPLVGVSMTPPSNWGDPSWPATGPTGGWGGADPIGKTQPIERGGTVAVNPTPGSWADAKDYVTAGVASDTYTPTMPVKNSVEVGAVRPVTGWLVCVEGVEKGKDFRLHSDMNYVGRSKTNDVVLANDPTVSRERHAMIAYDNRGKMFFFAPANGSSLVRQNGRPVLSTVELKAGDRLEIGEGIYLFVPLCGEEFEW